jgi:hypothetical protein
MAFQTLLIETSKVLCQFLARELPDLDRAWWNRRVVPCLTDRQIQDLERSPKATLDQLDLAALLRVLDGNWRELSRVRKWPPRVRNYIKELQTIRNHWAHMKAEGIANEELRRDFDTLIRFLTAIDASPKVVSMAKTAEASLSAPADVAHRTAAPGAVELAPFRDEDRMRARGRQTSGRAKSSAVQQIVTDTPPPVSLRTSYPRGYQALGDLVGDEQVKGQEARLEAIHAVCLEAWKRNLGRCGGRGVRYVLIAEAPPWTPVGVVRYFYNTFDQTEAGRPVAWIRATWKAFYPESDVPRKIDDALEALAEAGFLLVDALPFAIDYSRVRGKQEYSKLVGACHDYLLQQINDPLVSWDQVVRVALAFKKNGEALVETLGGRIGFPNGADVPLSADNIVATGSGFPTAARMAAVWGL